MSRLSLVLVLLMLGCETDSPTTPESPLQPTAQVQIRLVTTGVDPGVASFPVAVDQLLDRMVPVNGTLDVPITPGRHLLQLHRLPRHCQIQVPELLLGSGWAWERTVEVLAPGSAGFNVTCFEVGSLQLELHTTGTHVPSLYIGTIDNHPQWLLELPVNGTLTVQDIRAGEHRFSISTGPNCLISNSAQSTRLTIEIVPSETANVKLPVTCN